MWYLIWAIIVLPAMTYAALGRARAYEKDYDSANKQRSTTDAPPKPGSPKAARLFVRLSA